MKNKPTSEFERFDGNVKEILTVSHKEHKRREVKWKNERNQKKKAKSKRRPAEPST